MKPKTVKFTIEHVLFLWKHFRYIKEHELEHYFSLEEIESKGYCVEIRDSKKLIACGIMVSGYISFEAVHIDYRGKKLQNLLTKKFIEIAKENYIPTVCATVRCRNIASWKNFLSCGFRVDEITRYSNDEEGFELSKQINQ